MDLSTLSYCLICGANLIRCGNNSIKCGRKCDSNFYISDINSSLITLDVILPSGLYLRLFNNYWYVADNSGSGVIESGFNVEIFDTDDIVAMIETIALFS